VTVAVISLLFRLWLEANDTILLFRYKYTSEHVSITMIFNLKQKIFQSQHEQTWPAVIHKKSKNVYSF